MPGTNKALSRGHVCISGKEIHGIGFREATQKVAIEHGVSGIAKNIPPKNPSDDQRVEVILEGEWAAILAVRGEWLETGENFAKYTHYDFKRKIFINEFKGKPFEIG